MKPDIQAIDQLIASRHDELLREWLAEVSTSTSASGRDVATSREEAQSLLTALQEGLRVDGDPSRLADPAWERLHGLLEGLSASRAAKGLTAADTSRFVLALKRPMFTALQATLAARPTEMVDALWTVRLDD